MTSQQKIILSTFFILTTPAFSGVLAQIYLVEISLFEINIIDECHFGDEWSGYFSFGGEYMYKQNSTRSITLEPDQHFSLISIIFEENEKHNDYQETTTLVDHEDLAVGRYKFETDLYIEDEHTGRYDCNNATFRFSYIIDVTRK